MRLAKVVRWVLMIVALMALGITACGKDPASGGGGPTPPLSPKCNSDLECTGEKAHCDPFTGCVDCVLNAHCGADLRCVDKTCVEPTECVASDECQDDKASVCNPILGECVGCITDQDCGDAAACERGRCRPVAPCVNSRDCEEGTVCDRDRGYCVQCVSDGDCSEETACVEHSCVPRCTSDNDCKSGNLLCNHDLGYCVECVEQVDCPDVYHCSSGRCLVDICLEGTSDCDDTSNSILSCVADGSAIDSVYCFEGTTCTVSGGQASCTPWVCQPGVSSCSPDGSSLDVCNADGLGFSAGTNCEDAGGVCELDACTEVLCDAGARFCDAGVVYQCSSSGTSFISVQACTAIQFCNVDTATCDTRVCTPNAAGCDGTEIATCRADGSGVEAGADCADDDELCLNGACVPEVCEAGTTYCKDGSVTNCVDGGATEVIVQTCLAGQYCDEETATCRIDSCTPGSPACDGELAGTCNTEGSGLESGATDCADETDMACFDGECLDVICTTTRYCKDGNVFTCRNNGTGEFQSATCSAGQFCNPASAACQTDICVADSTGCFNNHIATCNSEGSGWIENTDCGADNLCVTGTCLPLICQPNTYFCNQEGNLHRCGSDGTTSTLRDTCTPSEYCEEGFSSCRPDVCVAGNPTCDGELVATCNSDGSGPEPGGSACPGGQTCDAGACADIVCAVDERFCEGQAVRTCNALGTGSSLYQTCSAASFCNEALNPVACQADICAAGAPACDGETLAVCEADGGGFTSQTTDCSASSEVCTGTACAASSEETIGTPTSGTSLSGHRSANRYYVSTPRTLTEIEQYITVTGTSQFTWIVYENTAATGSYTKIFESLNTSTGSATFHSSGAISVPLQAGHFYMIGVRVAGAYTAYYQSTSAVSFLSFGYTQYSTVTTNTGALPSTWSVSSSSRRYHQRLTTELP